MIRVECYEFFFTKEIRYICSSSFYQQIMANGYELLSLQFLWRATFILSILKFTDFGNEYPELLFQYLFFCHQEEQ